MKLTHSIKISLTRFILLMLILYGCDKTNSHREADDHNHAGDSHNEIVQLTADELREFGIELATAGPGKLEIHVSLPGEIVIPPDNLAHIHPRFPGMVKQVFKHIGDPVKKGQTLAIIEGNESLTEYEVKSLIDGTLVEKHLSLGEIVDDDTHGFVVANLSSVWAMLKLYQKDLAYVKTGQTVIISAGPDLPQSEGKIAYISPVIDEQTRTAEARVVLSNPNGYWKPGLFVTGRITTSDMKVDLAVPKTAVELYEGLQIVFVQTAEGFVPRAVKPGRTNESMIEVISGLNPGETYVSKGGFTIKAELQKGEFGSGHSH